jgi:hypothetical protein
MPKNIERQTPVMPKNALADAYEQLRPTARGTVMPPQDREVLEQYEENWGPEDKGVEPSPPAEGEVLVSPPPQPSSVPPPLGGFIAIDLVRMLVIGDNGEEFPIEAEQLRQSLKIMCRDMYLNALNSRIVQVSEALGLPLPEAPSEETVQKVPKKKARKRVQSKG